MPAQITSAVLEAYLHCRYKGHLKQADQIGTQSEYEVLTAEQRAAVRKRAIEQITVQHARGGVLSTGPLTGPRLKQGAAFLLDATVTDDAFSLRFDGLKKVDGPSKLGDYHYVPVLFHGGGSVRKEQRMLLDVYGLLLSRIQGRTPGHGIVWFGQEFRTTKVRLTPDLRNAERLLKDLQQSREAGPPRLVLNDHCPVCEFCRQCHNQAVQEDNLSLLRGLGEKEVSGYARKGILTLTQLAHTFRPRRKGKRAAARTHHRYYALQAVALRDKRVYVFGSPQVPVAPVRIYLDIESLPDEGFVYLIGMTVVEGETEQHHVFWADTRDQEPVIFRQFLAEVSKYPDAYLYCYGSYERTFLKRMQKAAPQKADVDRVLTVLVNVLSIVYSHIYLPCHSNGLKEVAGCLGYSWSDPQASGLQSIVWRKRWEASHADEWKNRLTTYNREDCAALRKVTELVYALGLGPTDEELTPLAQIGGLPVASVAELDRLGAVERRGKINFFHPDHQFINSRAHFDYQRSRVYVRTSKIIKKSRRKPGRRRNAKLRISGRVQIIARKCPECGGTEIHRWAKGKRGSGFYARHKNSFDLLFTAGGIKRRVVECRTAVHECRRCGRVFIPERYERAATHFHGLMSWAMYQHVAHRAALVTVQEMFEEFFGLSVHFSVVHRIKSILARYYRSCIKRLLAKIVGGSVLHADETQVQLRTGKGYVWVFATAEEVVYLYRPTREGDFLPELLKDFRGVLVSDFYAAYDALPCPQQKRLIHLIRDMNQEVLNSPFDTELQSITGPFGTLLRAVVEEVDRHGLKTRYLARHEQATIRFFDDLATQSFGSEAAETLRARLLKYRHKLFTFLQHDGVAWNNNNAENAIRRFAYYRDGTVGCLKETGLADYLVLLSIYQTCRYRGVSFLKFLLSGERDVDAFCAHPRRKRRRLLIELHPKGISRPNFGPSRKQPNSPLPSPVPESPTKK